ncbi:MAG: disulfide oxidoreductase [Patescibacteria group bacterium]
MAKERGRMKFSTLLKEKNLLYFTWFVSLAGTFGSLYFSEIRHLAPCVLCWYQRIFLYPLVILIPVGLMLRDKNIARYILPLSSLGLLIALFHNLLYYGLIPEKVGPCTAGVSCTVRQIEWFGFVGIPLLSLLAFAGITCAMILIIKSQRKDRA